MREARDILSKVFGYAEFRPLQEACIRAVLSKKDTLLIMPTGGGKSLCYQIPALMLPGLTIVISPLISLMMDQVRQLRALGIDAALLNSSLSDEEYEENTALVRRGSAKLLFLAPETLMKEDTLYLLRRVVISLFVIDEAHCISDWGHDFRPEYRGLMKIRTQFPAAACLAMTATATPRVRKDILANLGIDGQNEFIASFNRPNLFYEVAAKTDGLRQTLDFLNRFPNESGIIYCFSRKQVDDLAETLKERGYAAKPYHAGLSAQERTKNQELFIRDDAPIMVATIAFGMGINKPNVRFVLHYNLPKNIESYYQETGRAGRDGVPAHCLLLFGYGDIHNIRYLIDQKNDEVEKQAAAAHLNAMVHYAEAEGCRRGPLIRYFGEAYEIEKCGFCDNCESPKEATFDLTEPARKFLTCVSLTGERFGAAHLIDILRGSESEKVMRFRHERLEVYGSGKDYSARQWQAFVRQLIQKGFVRQDAEAFGAIKPTVKAGRLLKGEEPLLGFLPPKEMARQKESKAARRAAAGNADEELFQVLRKKRKEIADQANLPPYIIFSDKSLIDMSARQPRSLQEFAGVFGVGVKKLENYGAVFVKVIQEHLESKVPAA